MMKRSLKIDFRVKDCSNANYLVDEGFLPLGKIQSRNFIPDFSKLIDRLDDIYALGEIFRGMDDSQCRILIAALHYSSRLAKFNLSFGQPVYFNISAPRVDFVNCWYKGYAVSASRKKYTNEYKEKSWEYTIIALSTLRGKFEVTFHLRPESILTKEEFKKHKKKLIYEGKLRAPKKNLTILQETKWEDVINEEADADELRDIPKGDIGLDGIEKRVLKEWKRGKKKRDKYGIVDFGMPSNLPSSITFTDDHQSKDG